MPDLSVLSQYATMIVRSRLLESQKEIPQRALHIIINRTAKHDAVIASSQLERWLNDTASRVISRINILVTEEKCPTPLLFQCLGR